MQINSHYLDSFVRKVNTAKASHFMVCIKIENFSIHKGGKAFMCIKCLAGVVYLEWASNLACVRTIQFGL
jgi:hypothetical protein